LIYWIVITFIYIHILLSSLCSCSYHVSFVLFLSVNKMVKHNNIIPNQHFRKDWAKNVRTWFDQPAQKQKRRNLRLAKAKALAPRPLNKLQPVVRGTTLKYNNKVRAGRGFTLEELRAAGVNVKVAPTIGITVDHRRKNRSEEGFQSNVQRLKLYMSKLVVFPRKPCSQRVKKGDAPREQLSQAVQNLSKDVLPIAQNLPKIKARVIKAEEREVSVAKVLNKALVDSKLWGMREKRTKDRAAQVKGKKDGDDEMAE